MFLKLATPIPFWKPFCSYRLDAHRTAFRKFSVLWLISILPLIFAALAQPIPDSKTSKLYTFGLNLWQSFNGTHQFIYAVSFITPIFYLLWEQYLAASQHAISGKRKIADLKLAPPGFGWVLIWSVFVFLLTAVAYAISTTIQDPCNLTFLHHLSSKIAIAVYLFALLCWYLTILDSAGPAQSYTQEIKKKENDDKDRFSERIAGREESND